MTTTQRINPTVVDPGDQSAGSPGTPSAAHVKTMYRNGRVWRTRIKRGKDDFYPIPGKVFIRGKKESSFVLPDLIGC